MPKNTVALILHASKVMLKILQARLQQFVNPEIPDVQAGFRKARGTRDQIANIHWIIKKARVPEKHLFFKFYFIFKLYLIVLVLPNIEMNPPQVYMCSPF